MDQPNNLHKYENMFNEQMQKPDKLQNVLLKGHLIIEAAIDNLIVNIFFHPDHLFKGRFTFIQKVQIARSYALRKDENTIWNLILSVNEVRNEVAHNLAGDKRNKKLKQLRRLFLSEATVEMRTDLEMKFGKLENLQDEFVVTLSCALCTGFLSKYEDDIIALRRMIDGLDIILNPDQARVDRKTPKQARAKK